MFRAIAMPAHSTWDLPPNRRRCIVLVLPDGPPKTQYIMQIVRMGLVAALVIAVALGVLRATELVSAAEFRDVARMAYGALLVVVVAGIAVRPLLPSARADATEHGTT